MQIELQPELPPSRVYEIASTSVEVSPRYAIAYPVSSLTAVNTTKVIIDFITRHAYLPTVMITNTGSVFVSHVMHKSADV